MTIEVFNRVENKFLMNNHQYNLLLPFLNKEMVADDYSSDHKHYTIQNIYYDTDDKYLIKHSLSKPFFKEKLRIRAYGKVNLESLVYIELKKKYNGVVNKRRSQMRLCEAYVLIHSKKMPEIKSYHNVQVLKEILAFISRYPVKASTYIAYDRRAYKLGEFRVTIDSNIRTRSDYLRLEYDDYGERLLEPGYKLLEVKSNRGLPLWFVKQLSTIKLYKTSFSKYGKEFVRKHVTYKEKGVYICSKPYLVTQQSQPSQ